MALQIYLNGEYVPKERAVISVFDHGYLYGDGVFEGIRAYNGRVFRLKEHLVRLYESAKSIALKIPVDIDEMERIVVETCRVNNLSDAYIRLVVSRGPGDLGLDPRKCPNPTLVCIADKIALYPAELYNTGLKIVTVAVRRNTVESTSPRIKSLNYLNSILAKIDANNLGYNEVLMLDSAGLVVEATGDNIFIIKGNRLLTPPAYMGILEGITRKVVMDIAREKGFEVAEAPFTRHDIFNADECFLTGTAAEIIPVVQVDGRPIGDGQPGSKTADLITAFREEANSTGTPIFD